jgi:peptidoglycan hydrolase-like protein with peptidoglycan-binding domain
MQVVGRHADRRDHCSGGGGAPVTTTTVPEVTSTTVTTTTVPEVPTTVPETTTTTIPETTTTTVPTMGSCPTIDPERLTDLLGSNTILRQGSRGRAVRQLELFLLTMGYTDITPDRAFDSQTRAAVKAFQDDRGLPVDGKVGSRTRGEIALIAAAAGHAGILDATDRLLTAGASGADVRDLQHLLALLGFDPGPTDGRFRTHDDGCARSAGATPARRRPLRRAAVRPSPARSGSVDQCP